MGVFGYGSVILAPATPFSARTIRCLQDTTTDSFDRGRHDLLIESQMPAIPGLAIPEFGIIAGRLEVVLSEATDVAEASW
ncbi:hypothetical protein [Mesorhizobium australicum]|uniref:hypothetical protein n=1 Tax=Mesorhizobium australicum TaxID=536018 RepID=UPI000A1C9CA0|nr:hypothetical protein [Mesorhizobium australicum]